MAEGKLDIEATSEEFSNGIYMQPEYTYAISYGYIYQPNSYIVDGTIYVYPTIVGIEMDSMFPGSDGYLVIDPTYGKGFTYSVKMLEGTPGEWSHVNVSDSTFTPINAYKMVDNTTINGEVIFDESHGENIHMIGSLEKGVKVIFFGLKVIK